MSNIVMKCKVHGELTLDQCRVYIRQGRKKYRTAYDCKECTKIRNRLHKINNKEKFRKANYKDWNGIEIIKCSYCKIEKNHNEFTNSELKIKYPKCKLCAKKYGKIMREKYKDKYYEKKKIYINENREEARKRGRKCLLKTKYNMTLENYNEMLKKQNHVCAICNNPEEIRDKRLNCLKSLSIDHCHKVGKIRGLLCDKCNRGLGYFKDSIKSLKSAIKYLELNG